MVLTVITGRQARDWFDIDVPEDCPVDQLKQLLGMRIYGHREATTATHQYIMEGKFPDGMWFTISDDQGIVESGLREGAYIRVQRTYSTTTEEAPVVGRRSLFQNEANGVYDHLKLN